MSLASLQNQDSTIKKADGTLSDQGVVALGRQVDLRARVERVRIVEVDEGGRESTILAEIFAKKGANIARNDIAVVDGEDMLVLSVEPAVHGSGRTHHLEVKAGRRSGA